MKKFIALIISAIMLITCTTIVSANDNTENIDEKIIREQVLDSDTVTIKAVQPLYNFADEEVAEMYYFEPRGYAIYDETNKVVLEYSTEQDNPYFTDVNAQYYYAGVLQYMEKKGDEIIDLHTGNSIMEESTNSEFRSADFYSADESCEKSISNTLRGNETRKMLPYGTRAYNCNTKDNSCFGVPSSAGVCGSLACSVVVAYYDDYIAFNYCDSRKKSSGSAINNTYGFDLVKEMVGYVEPGKGNATFLTGLNDYFSARNINNSISMNVLNNWMAVTTRIDRNRPVIIGLTHATGPSGQEYENHWVVATGYRLASDGAKQFYINDGWGGLSILITAKAAASNWTLAQ